LEVFPADEAGVRAGDQGGPFGGRFGEGALVAVGVADVSAPPVAERAGIARVVQHEQHVVVPQRLPVQLAGARAGEVATGEGEAVAGEGLDHGAGRAGCFERGEQVRQGTPHAGVGIKRDLVGGVVDQPDRQPDGQLAAGGLGEDAALQPGADVMQFSFGHGAFEAEQQPVVDRARVIQPVLVADQCGVERTQLQQPMPVGIVAGLLRAGREHSRPSTIPALPRDTSATRRWNPARSAALEPDWP
jgi:hypothetical protein